jgi:hypothetical protein
MPHAVHALRLLSTLACGVVLVAFGLWATDEGRASSEQQIARVAGGAPGSAPQAALAKHDGLRGTIEDANATLTRPFQGIADSKGAWLRNGVPALLALLSYGLLARLLINYIPQRR